MLRLAYIGTFCNTQPLFECFPKDGQAQQQRRVIGSAMAAELSG